LPRSTRLRRRLPRRFSLMSSYRLHGNAST
jgi:hypothetical protein